MQIKRMRGALAGITLPLLLLGLGRRLVHRAPAGRGPSPRWSRAPTASARATTRGRSRWCAATSSAIAIRARAHAPEAERNHHHQELSEHRAQQPERCGAGDLAGRHRQELQRGRAALLGYTEADLLGKPLVSFIDEPHRSAFDPTTTRRRKRARRCCAPPAGRPFRCPWRLDDHHRGPAVPGQHLRGAQHHRAQARRAAHPLSGALRHAHQDAEPHAVPAPAAAGDRARARNQRSLALLYLDWTGSRRSTTPSATRPATARSRS
jgi:PAS domain-containing protein